MAENIEMLEEQLNELQNRKDELLKKENLDEKIKELQDKRKSLLKKEKGERRKARHKRLIERGAMFEKYFSFDKKSSSAEVELFLKQILSDKNFVEYAEKIRYRIKKILAANAAEHNSKENENIE